MKRTLIFVSLIILCFFSQAFATVISLENDGDRVVYDREAGLYWFPLLTELTNRNFRETQSFIDGLNVGTYGGKCNWKIADHSDFEVLAQDLLQQVEELPDLFDPLWTRQENDYTVKYWDGSSIELDPDLHTEPYAGSYLMVEYHDGWQDVDLGSWGTNHNWSAGDAFSAAWVCAVPEPSASLLLCLGIVALFRHKRTKSGSHIRN